MFFFLIGVRWFEIEAERFFMLNISTILLFLILTVNSSVAFVRLLLSLRLITSAVDPSDRILLFPGFKYITYDRGCLCAIIKFALDWSSWYAVAVLPSVDCGLRCLIFARTLFLLLNLLFADVWLFGVGNNIAFVITLNYAVGLAHFLLYVTLL